MTDYNLHQLLHTGNNHTGVDIGNSLHLVNIDGGLTVLHLSTINAKYVACFNRILKHAYE